MSEIKHWNGKDWRWYAKCRNGRGQWANAHDTSTHVDGFCFKRRSRLRSSARHDASKSSSDTSGKLQDRSAHIGVSDGLPQDASSAMNLTSAQLSLLDALPTCCDADSESDE